MISLIIFKKKLFQILLNYKKINIAQHAGYFKLRIIELKKNNTECNIIQIIAEHRNCINGLKRLNYYQNEIIFASSSNDGKILLWKLENNSYNKFQEIECLPVEDIFDPHHQIEGLEESIKYHQLICSYSLIECIYFCNLNNLQEIVPLCIKVNRCIRALKIIENGDILIAAGNSEINIINVELKAILISIKYGVNLQFNCIFQKQNGNILITEYDAENETKIKEFNFNKNGLNLNLIRMKNNIFKSYITTIVELENGDLIFGGYDGTFKCFKKIQNKKQLIININ